MGLYMIKKLLSINVFIISLFPFVHLKASERSYVNTPRNSKIFNKTIDESIIDSNRFCQFLTINIPVL